MNQKFYIPCLIAIAIITVLTESACGEPPADPDPTTDGGGTDTDTGNQNTDAGVEDAGNGDDTVTTPDAGKADCSDLRAKLQKEWKAKSGSCGLIGYSLTAKVEAAEDTCITTFDGACRIALPFKGTGLPINAGPEDGVSATANIVNNELVVKYDDNGTVGERVYE